MLPADPGQAIELGRIFRRLDDSVVEAEQAVSTTEEAFAFFMRSERKQ